jgi:hypothetical protein
MRTWPSPAPLTPVTRRCSGCMAHAAWLGGQSETLTMTVLILAASRSCAGARLRAVTREPLSIAASLGLVVLSGATAAGVALAELGTCFSQTGDSSPPGTRVAAVCGSDGAQTAFNDGLVVAVVIAGVAVAAGYVAASRRIAIVGTWIAVGLIAVLALWGFANRATLTS